MLSYSATVIEALARSGSTLVVLVDVWTSATNFVRCASHPAYIASGSNQRSGSLVAAVSGGGQSIDPITRAVTVADWEVLLTDDGIMRDVAAAQPLRGLRVRVLLGTTDLVADDFATIADNLIIDEVLPDHGVIRLRLADALWGVLDVQRVGFLRPSQPERAIQRILLSVYSTTQAPDVNFAPVAADAHHRVSRAQAWNAIEWKNPRSRLLDLGRGARDRYTGAGQEVSALDLINSLAQFAQLTVRANESGTFSCSRYDPARAVDLVISTIHEIRDWEQTATYDGEVTEVVGTFTDSTGGNPVKISRSTAGITVGGGAISGAGATAKTIAIDPSGWVSSTPITIHDAADTQVEIGLGGGYGWPAWHGLAGSGYDTTTNPPGASITAGEELTVTRTAYWLIYPQQQSSSVREIVTATALGVGIVGGGFGSAYNSFPGVSRAFDSVAVYDYAYVNATVVRAQLGTTALDWSAAARIRRAVDITIWYRSAGYILERSQRGMPRVKLSLPVHRLELQVGDFVQFSGAVRDFCPYLGKYGEALNTVTWEVVSKNVTLIGDGAAVDIELAWVTYARDPLSLTPPTLTMVPSLPGPFSFELLEPVIDEAGAIVTDEFGQIVYAD